MIDEVGVYEELDAGAYDGGPPPLLNALSELPRTLLEMAGLMAAFPLLGSLRRGDNHPVLVLPGFMAGDESTLILRRYLNVMGYHSLPWALGRNTGRPELMQHLLVDRFLQLSEACGARLSVIGQSLGGVFARELARLYPDRIRQIITLGSPIGTRHSNTTLPIVRRLFEQSSGMDASAMHDLLTSIRPDKSPPVPSTAIYSRGDGIVNWRVCREAEEDHQTQNIEVIGSHCGMAFNPAIYYVIADRLAQPEDDWQRFEAGLPGIGSSRFHSGS